MSVDTLPGALVLLTRLARSVYLVTGEEKLGMTYKQYGVLTWIPADGVSQQDLATTLCLDANAIVLLLNSCEDEGWIERRRDPTDRRRHVVFRTEAGTRRLRDAERAMDGVEDEVLAGLAHEDRAILRDLLARAQGAG
jgi:DNA-binding MarR family transcriptional regulator